MSLTKASYSLINGVPINVLDYGAVGDGITNCTTAFQTAITYCSTLKTLPEFAGATDC